MSLPLTPLLVWKPDPAPLLHFISARSPSCPHLPRIGARPCFPSHFCPIAPAPPTSVRCPAIPRQSLLQVPSPSAGLGAVSPTSAQTPPPLQPGSRLALHPWLPCPSLAGVCLSVHPPRLSSHPRGVEPGTKRTLPQPRGLAGWAREGAVGFEVGGHSRSRLGPREVRPAAGVERAKGLALAGGGAPGPRDTARPPVLPAAGRGPGTSSGAPCPPPWTHHPLFH